MNKIDLSLSVVIPTYQRGEVLLDTLEQLLQQKELADEVIVVDQTDYDETETVFKVLQKKHKSGEINWLRLLKPSIPIAMNTGLKVACSHLVLFLDDDVTLNNELICQHKKAFTKNEIVATVGQILQPGQVTCTLDDYQSEPGLNQDLNFPFNADELAVINNCMAGNLCVDRLQAIAAGAFDEQFYSVAYRFETDFCRRLIRYSNKKFLFVPEASLYHLKCERGGTRSDYADFLVASTPNHSYGDYYFALKHGSFISAFRYILVRFFSSFFARFYLTRPWWLPVRFAAELRGLFKAIALKKQGPRYINKHIEE